MSNHKYYYLEWIALKTESSCLLTNFLSRNFSMSVRVWVGGKVSEWVSEGQALFPAGCHYVLNSSAAVGLGLAHTVKKSAQ